MTGRPALGLLIALAVEASHWTRLRWEFDEEAAARGWQISMIGVLLATVLLWLENRITAVPQLLTWLPALLLPMQFVQSYGTRDALPLRTFSFFARQRRERARKLGMEQLNPRLNFGNFYFCVCLVAATLGKSANGWLFFAGLVALSAWMLARYTRGSRIAFAAALLMAVLFSIAGQVGIRAAIDRLKQMPGGGDSSFDPNFARTRIGDLTEIKLSPDIMWRIRVEQGGMPPRLLRTAGYNAYGGGIWRKTVPSMPGLSGPDFQDLTTLELTLGEPYYLVRPGADREAIRPELPRFTLRGAAENNAPLPLPGTAASLTGFELDGIERNSLGTVRLTPAKSILSGTVLWGDSGNPELAPMIGEAVGQSGKTYPIDTDLKVPAPEKDAVRQAAADLALDEAGSLREKLAILNTWFQSEFAYTRYLSIDARESGRTEPTAITRFLTETRRGHCEYFATAATLLLREAGIPARYAIGYSVMELDPKRREWLVRGLHRHAWCRVWDEASGLWIDFDPTPPDWLAMETQRPNSMQWLHDGIQRLREDFFIWRNDERNRTAVFIVMGLIALAVFLFIARRLWRSRRRVHPALPGRTAAPPPGAHTALHSLENRARKIIGPRPTGQTFARWLQGLHPAIDNPALLDEAISLHQRLRFDPAPPAPSYAERLAELVQQLDAALRELPAKK
jgi:protein-glutamine gamma-glutamyltransferase